MANELVHCPLCKNECSRRSAGHRGYSYDCKACKTFGVDELFERIAREYPPLSPYILAGYSRYRFENGDDPPVFRYHEDISEAKQRDDKGNDPHPKYSAFVPTNVEEQLVRILGFLLKTRSELGEWQELVPDHDFTICFAKSPNEFRELLRRAETKGWIERRANMRSIQARLTADGEAAFAQWKLSENPMPEHPERTSTEIGTSIFIVHGHDDAMKQHVARVVQQLGLRPIILHEQPNRGRTLIEKFETNSEVGFAVVLLSPDDLAYSLRDGSLNETKPRARQNVILELGYFVGKLGRDRVLALKRGDELEIPNDFNGVAYTPYDQSGNWRIELVRELRAAGYQVSADVLLT